MGHIIARHDRYKFNRIGILKPKLGLGMMWLFIGSLVATQIYMQWGTDWRSVFVPLKGLIIPSLITWLLKSQKPRPSS